MRPESALLRRIADLSGSKTARMFPLTSG